MIRHVTGWPFAPFMSQVPAAICPGAWASRISCDDRLIEPSVGFCPFVPGLEEKDSTDGPLSETENNEGIADDGT